MNYTCIFLQRGNKIRTVELKAFSKPYVFN